MARGGAPNRRAPRSGPQGGRPKREPMQPEDLIRASLLKKAREGAGITQERMGELLEVTQSSVSAWEQGKKPIPAEVFQRLQAVAQSGAFGPAPDVGPPPGEHGPPGDGQPGFVFTEPQAGADVPPDVAALAGQIEQGLKDAAGKVDQTLVPGVGLAYTLLGDGINYATKTTAGDAYKRRSMELAVSAVAAAEANETIKRLVMFCQVGPVGAFVTINVMVAIEVYNEIRRQKEDQAGAEAAAGQERERQSRAEQPFHPGTAFEDAQTQVA